MFYGEPFAINNPPFDLMPLSATHHSLTLSSTCRIDQSRALSIVVDTTSGKQVWLVEKNVFFFGFDTITQAQNEKLRCFLQKQKEEYLLYTRSLI